MSVELFKTAVEEGRPVCYYLFRDLGIGKDCKYFVETGTHMGGSVQFALDLGFDEAFSCEMMESRYNHCMEKFSENDNVSLWLGDSEDCFSEMMKQVDSKKNVLTTKVVLAALLSYLNCTTLAAGNVADLLQKPIRDCDEC